ncbi:MAG: hypothetical protein EGR89_04110 [[Eubacterium] rectale]|nr:hypothetical protein [Agathobacter rectalis]
MEINFTISDVIQIIGILASLITSILAIVISVLTLKQNSKMIEESTRPYVAIYSKTTNFQSPQYYLVVKNFGQSGAIISSIKCTPDLTPFSYRSDHIPFANFTNTYIAPGQSFTCNVKPQEFCSQDNCFLFKIEYSANGKQYFNEYAINPKADADLIHVRAATDGKEIRTISYALQDLVEKQL